MAERLMPRGRAIGWRTIAEALEAYLRSRPHAADSLDGIARWWLTGELQNAPREVVEEAVESLCKRGLLRAERHESGVTLYRSITGLDDTTREP